MRFDGEGIDAVLDREQARYEAELEAGWDEERAVYCEVPECPARASEQCCYCDGHYCAEHLNPPNRDGGARSHGDGCDRSWWAERVLDERVDDDLDAEAAASAHRTGGAVVPDECPWCGDALACEHRQ